MINSTHRNTAALVRPALLLGIVIATLAQPTQAARTAIPTELPLTLATSADIAANHLPLLWQDQLDTALTLAGVEYRPLLALFSSPTCAWCKRLKSDVFSDPVVKSLLQHFSLVEIDVSLDPRTASLYQISGVPTILILSPDGRPRSGVSGFVAATGLADLLRDALNPSFATPQDKTFTALLSALATNGIPDERWDEVALALGRQDRRQTIRDHVFALTPPPRRQLVRLLADSRLAVRLGALELLEELSGKSFNFDPWRTTGWEKTNGLAAWTAWAENTNTQTSVVFSALTTEQVEAYLADLISDNRRRSLRAMQMLEKGGPGVIAIITRFLDKHTSLPEGARMMVLEARSMLQIPPGPGIDPSQLAHRLIFGTLDVRLKSIAQLKGAGPNALPLLQECLLSPDAIIRETAIDTLVAGCGTRAVDVIKTHLITEQDADVVFTALRGLGHINSKKGLKLLVAHLDNSDEELVIVALESIARLKSRTVADDIKRGLTDPRWRVRAATLDTIAKLKLKSLAEDIESLLDDDDGFVRFAAVKALAAVSATRARTKLEAAFLANDELKAPVVAAFGSMDVALPRTFAKPMRTCAPQTLLAILDAMDDCDEQDLWLIKSLATDDNLDVACAATRLIAAKGTARQAYQQILTRILTTGKRATILAALDTFRLEREATAEFQTLFPDWFMSLSIPTVKPEDHQALKDLFRDFEDPPDTTPATATEPVVETVNLSDLFGSFMADGNADTNSSPGKSMGGYVELVNAMQELLKRTDDQAIPFKAALALSRLGCPDVVAYLGQDLDQRTIAERVAIAESLEKVTTDSVLPVLTALLGDDAESVRSAALNAGLNQNAKATFIDAVFTKLLKPSSRLRPYEVYGYRIENAARADSSKAVLHKWVIRLLAEVHTEEMLTLGLIVLEKTWRRGDEKHLDPFLSHNAPLVRRAAYHALGKGSRSTFDTVVERVAQDTPERVRAVLPNIYMRDSTRWMHYFDEKHFENDHMYWYSQSQTRRRLKPDIVAALKTLTDDPSPSVRVDAFFCLLSNLQSFDLGTFIATLDSLPDRRAAEERIGEYLVEHYKKLGPGFRVLVPYIEAGDADPDDIQKIKRHFKINPHTTATARPSYQAREPTKTTEQATFVEIAPEPDSSAAESPTTLLYFRSPGCGDCERVDRLIEQLGTYLTNLNVRTFNIRKIKAMRLNEALSERFRLPDAVRLVAPAIFFRSGYLIKSDITFAAMGHLAAQSAPGDNDDWYVLADDELAAADDSIDTRYTRMSFWVVGLAGLIDGVNPCAFATIIFLISYLQVTRRRPRQIIAVGLAFVSGVFLAYFVLGLGLVEVVARLTVLKSFSRFMNVAIAAFAFVIMVLSIRDGILCLQGRLSDMTLQLPEVLKQRIHAVIRTGARQTHFIIAAFFVGVAISVLELACTGQVYAPTILFMLKTGRSTAGAMLYPLFYNLAFVIPLIAIFVLATLGLQSDTLTRFMRRHAALVKFCTAGLFLILFLIFLFGDRLHELTQAL